MQRFQPDAGIAIGPILFVIALLGIIGTVIAAGTGGFGMASVTDRVYNDMYSQANLIRTKINECNIRYGTNNNGDGFPASDTNNGTPVCALDCEGDPSTSVAGNDCSGNGMTEQNLWYGIRPTILPQPTTGMSQWYYMNAGASGGRCIWAAPSSPSAGITQGLTQTAAKFTSQEVIFNPSGTTQRFVLWITYPTGTADSHCASP
jgi:hypothetical protein